MNYTYNRWKQTDSGDIDKHTMCKRFEPANKLNQEERKNIGCDELRYGCV